MPPIRCSASLSVSTRRSSISLSVTTVTDCGTSSRSWLPLADVGGGGAQRGGVGFAPWPSPRSAASWSRRRAGAGADAAAAAAGAEAAAAAGAARLRPARRRAAGRSRRPGRPAAAAVARPVAAWARSVPGRGSDGVGGRCDRSVLRGAAQCSPAGWGTGWRRRAGAWVAMRGCELAGVAGAPSRSGGAAVRHGAASGSLMKPTLVRPALDASASVCATKR